MLGMLAMAAGFIVGIFLLRRILSGSHPVIGVARTIVEEAIGTRLSILLVMLVVITLPMLPLLLDPAERLAYRLQFFLTWALSAASVLLALMTIALVCSSVCGDIESRRIHMALSKPLRRWEYLFGKWLGVVLLDAMLVVLAGCGVYGFTLALAQMPALDAEDRLAVDEQVLTARAQSRPVHPRGAEFERTVAATIEEIRRDDPATFDKDPIGARKRILSQRIHEWHTVTPDTVSSFVFEGLDPDRIRAPVVQLRLEPFAGNSNISEAEVRFVLWLNDRPYPVKNGRHEEYTFPVAQIHTINLPTSAIAEDGTLRLTIANRNLVMPGEEFPTIIAFTPGEGLEILYRVGGFGSNFLRGLVVAWSKLALLAAVAAAAAAWLEFPIAFLAGAMVFVTAAASAFFADAIDIYTGRDYRNATIVSMLRMRGKMLWDCLAQGAWWDATKTVWSFAADAFLALVPSFGSYDSITEVGTGRVVPMMEVTSGLIVLALAYPVMLLLFGWALLERRDLVSGTT
jgi:ABC-type transport system involved in multi-copper enzyme maturation permease subunit